MSGKKKRRFSAVEINKKEHFIENASYYTRWAIEKWWSCCDIVEINEALRAAQEACVLQNLEQQKHALMHLIKLSVEYWASKKEISMVEQQDEPRLYYWALEIMHGPDLLFAAGDRNEIYGLLAIEKTSNLTDITQKYFETRDLLEKIAKKEKSKAIEYFL